jgi:uncharacterized protein
MLAAALAILAGFAVASPTPAPPTRWVEDHAGLLSESARTALDARLDAYERATGHQVVVWIGTTLEGASLDEWAVRTFAAWKLGRESFDDGIALFVLASDRTIAIEVGYGLEDRVPDATASRVIREVMAPRLQAGDADGAVTAGADALLAAIEGQAWTDDGAVIAAEEEPTLLTYIFLGIAGLAFLIFAIKHPRKALALIWLFGRGTSRFGGGGGGSGGFRGGGGRSGGGGARGGW